MHLIIDHVTELEEVGDPNRSRLVKLLTRTTIEEVGLTVAGKPCLVGPFVHIVEGSPVKDRSGELTVQTSTSPCKDSLKDLTEVHSRRHPQRVQTEIHRSTIGKERHIFLAHDLRDNTLITMTTCHLIPYLNLTLLGDVDLGHLDNARG